MTVKKSVTVSLGRCKSLNEVIQVGYGTVKKKRCDRSCFKFLLRTLIKGKRNPESLISGRIAGVNVRRRGT
jgi:hypothetical protein